MHRPDHLPDFANPPLDEVVLGVQFEPVPEFVSVDTKDIWTLFQDEFPIVQDQPLLPPQFETFGGGNLQPSFQFQVGSGPIGSRQWFVSPQGNNLLQFQSDRFLSNWRRHHNNRTYPRFEKIFAAYEGNLGRLALDFSSRFSYSMSINQAEISYINIVPVSEFSEIGRWLRVWSDASLAIEGIGINFSEIVRDGLGKPFARLYHTVQSVYLADGKSKACNFSLTFRGRPSGSDIDSALSFLASGREAIVTRFGDLTTPMAREFWGMKA